MRPIYSREELTDVVARHAPTKACATAMRENRATVLGGFKSPECLPCWIVRVKAKYGREWIIAVECDEQARRYSVKILDAVPWEHWIGSTSGRRPLIDGDDPCFADQQRAIALRRKHAAQTPAAPDADCPRS